MKGFLRIIIYVLIISLPLITVAIGNPAVGIGFVFELGKIFALLAFTILALQPVLSARIHWIEKPFGLDMVLLFHRNMAVFAAILLLAHPVLLSAGIGDYSLIYSTEVQAFVYIGRAVLLILLIQVILSAFRMTLRIEFEKWRALHNLFALTLVLGAFLHGWLANNDLQLLSMKIIWIALLLMALSFYLYHKVFVRFIKEKRFKIVAVEQESEKVNTLKMEPLDGSAVEHYLPGQFHFLTLHREKFPAEEHPFTISSGGTSDRFVCSTIKMSGDFTHTIPQTKPEQQVTIRGPYGRFSYLLYPKEKNIVFIAGGIGITPFISMLRHMDATSSDHSVLLLYANKTIRNIVFGEELSQMQKRKNIDLKVIYYLSHPEEDWQGESGHITGDKIKQHCAKDFHKRSFWLCGPAPMQKSLLKQISDLGISTKQIHAENFSL